MADWLTLNYYPDPLIEGYEVPESFHNDCSGGSGGGDAGGGSGDCPACNFIGSGSPEGVVTGVAGSRYYDTATGDHYIKATGSGNTGWATYIA